jgi:hypothetical protein
MSLRFVGRGAAVDPEPDGDPTRARASTDAAPAEVREPEYGSKIDAQQGSVDRPGLI